MRKLSRNEWIAAAVAVAFVGYMFFGDATVALLSRLNGSSIETMDTQEAPKVDTGQVQVQDIVTGPGAEIKNGQQVAVHYVLKLTDGTVLQDSKEVGGGQPFVFTLGAGQLIPGWEMGVQGMKVGGKRVITIPPELGYGSQTNGPIPANSVLVFEIEVVAAQ